jgi:hypothetical protein
LLLLVIPLVVLGARPELGLAQVVAGFDDLHLALDPNSYWNGSERYYVTEPGAEYGEFTSVGLTFNNYFTVDSISGWEYWDCWAYSNMADTATPGFENQFSAFAGCGAGGSSNYGLVYTGLWGGNTPTISATPGNDLLGAYFTNTTYAALSMLNGDQFAKKFGGLSGNDPDWFLLEIVGEQADGSPAGTVEFYLADYRFEDNLQDYIVDAWTWVDLSGLDNPNTLEFALSSSDNDPIWGMNTPAYFAMDSMTMASHPCTLTSIDHGNWSAASTWDDSQLVPCEDCAAVVRTHSVTVAIDDGAALSLLVEDSGQVAVDAERTLVVGNDMEVGNSMLNVQGALQAGLVTVVDSVLEVGSAGTLNTDADLVFENSEYVCELDGPDNGLVTAAGDVEIIGDTVLEVRADGKVGDAGYASRTIITAAGPDGVTGSFAEVPADQQHLGFGVFHQDVQYVGAPEETITAIDLLLFQALDGDTDGDRDVDFSDFGNLANMYTGTGASGRVWTDGDFDGDGDVDFSDFNWLANYYTGSGVEYEYDGLKAGGGIPGDNAVVPEPA